jgi:hypothetical protein
MGDEAAGEEALITSIVSALDSSFERLARAAEGRRLVVSLSGGADSRLIAGMLKRHGVKDVLCFSYGLPGNSETVASEAVARALGYDLRYIPYTACMWARWMESEDMRRFSAYSMGGTSLPGIQDLPAVAALTEDGTVCKGLFVLGHSVATMGQHVPAWLVGRCAPSRTSVARCVLRRHLNLWLGVESSLPPSMFRKWVGRVESQLTLDDKRGALPHVALLEAWDRDNRQAKLITNSVRTCEFYDHDWMLPLWDDALQAAYNAVPESLRWQRSLYIRVARERIFRGPLACLREIPVGRSCVGSDASRNGPGWRTRAASWATDIATELACALGLAVAAQRLRRRWFPKPFSPTALEYWFTDEADPASVLVRDVLRKHGVREALPPILWSILQRHLGRPVATCSCNGLFAAIILARWMGEKT